MLIPEKVHKVDSNIRCTVCSCNILFSLDTHILYNLFRIDSSKQMKIIEKLSDEMWNKKQKCMLHVNSCVCASGAGEDPVRYAPGMERIFQTFPQPERTRSKRAHAHTHMNTKSKGTLSACALTNTKIHTHKDFCLSKSDRSQIITTGIIYCISTVLPI